MSNEWSTNPIILDTANDDITYDDTHDANSRTLSGTAKYTTAKIKIKKIQITNGANGNIVKLTQCLPGTITGPTIIDRTLETGDLNPEINFGEGQWFDGLIPVTLSGSCKALIHIA